jgi:hypothetical protein
MILGGSLKDLGRRIFLVTKRPEFRYKVSYRRLKELYLNELNVCKIV